jgi:ATP-binding cassette, subfamily F, member 3
MFGYDDLSKRCGSLSGGELNRLQLARASALKANFLVLDEPTNHLDIPTREAVEDALEDFEGTVLVVSHDRYFLEKIAGRVVFIEESRFNEYEGSFGEYWRDVGSLRSARLVRKVGRTARWAWRTGLGCAPARGRRRKAGIPAGLGRLWGGTRTARSLKPR